MNFIKFLKKYPFLSILSFSALFLSAVGFAGKNNLYSDYQIVMAKTPQLAAVFEGMGEGKYPWMIDLKRTILQNKVLNSPNAASDVTAESDSNTPRYNNKDSDSSIAAVISNKNANTAADGKDDAKSTPEAARKTAKNNITGKTGNANASSHKGNQDSKNDGGENTVIGSDGEKNTDISSASNQNSNKNTEKSKDRNIIKKGSEDLSDPDTAKDNENTKAAGSEYKFKTVAEKYFNDALFIGPYRKVFGYFSSV